MFTNRKGCTIYEKSAQNRSPTFIRHEIENIYIEDTQSQEIRTTQGSAYRNPQNEALIFIPENSLTDYFPKVSDKIVSDIIPDEIPPENAMTVMNVKNFCYGSPTVRHMEVTAE